MAGGVHCTPTVFSLLPAAASPRSVWTLNAVPSEEQITSSQGPRTRYVGLNESDSFMREPLPHPASPILARAMRHLMREGRGYPTAELLITARAVEVSFMRIRRNGANGRQEELEGNRYGESRDASASENAWGKEDEEDLLRRLVLEQLHVASSEASHCNSHQHQQQQRQPFAERDTACVLHCPTFPSILAKNHFRTRASPPVATRPNFIQCNDSSSDHLVMSTPMRGGGPFVPLTAVPVIAPTVQLREQFPIIVMADPTFDATTQKLRVFVTIERDIFHTAGLLRSMAPRAYAYPSFGEDGRAREPFRWFIARAEGMESFPREAPLVLPDAAPAPRSVMEAVRQRGHPMAMVPMDALLSVGVASSWVLSGGPPVTVGLEIDLNPDRDLDHMHKVEITLLQRYWALCRGDAPTSRNYTCMEEGVPYVVGIEVYFAEQGSDAAEEWVTVLRDFEIPKGSRTQQTRKELRNLLDRPQRYT